MLLNFVYSKIKTCTELHRLLSPFERARSLENKYLIDSIRVENGRSSSWGQFLHKKTKVFNHLKHTFKPLIITIYSMIILYIFLNSQISNLSKS